MMALSIGANLLKPWPVALIIDHIVAGKPAPTWLPEGLRGAAIPTLLGLAALTILILHSSQGIFAAVQNLLSIKAGLHGLARIRKELFATMQRLSLAFFQVQNQGDLIYRATWDTYAIQTIFQHGLFKFLSSFATIFVMVAVMWRVNAALTLITLAVFPPLLLSMYFFGRQMNIRSLAAHQADSKVTSLVQQNISSLPLVQSFTREPQENVTFAGEVERSLGMRIAQHRMEILYWLVIAVIFGIATSGLTWWGAREIVNGRLTIGELVIFLSYLGQLYDPLNQLSHVGATVSDANAGAQRIFEILDARSEVPEDPNPTPFPKVKSALSQPGEPQAPANPEGVRISFEGVQFGYDSAKPVLRDLNFMIEPRETVGIIGLSGSGKTTLLNLLPRFYDPDQGVIRIEGVDTRRIGLKDLRMHIAFVFQESFLLPGTIAQNIQFGREESTRNEVENAARAANAHEFIVRLPKGYDTIVGEGAARLSAGEKQRISIARAFLKDAPILLLDEPTSSLDLETEAEIVDSLMKLMANRTTLMAAHRFATLKKVDRIIVIEKGCAVEIGTPAELIRSGGYYSRLAALARA